MKPLASLVLIAGLTSPAAADDPEMLLDQARCGMCHQIETPMLGPSYQAIAERYRDQDGAADEIFSRMREGSQGVWGQAPMPPVAEAALNDEQLQIVIDWILKQ
jgi:cytochrome c